MKKSIFTIIALVAMCFVGQAQAPTTFGIGTGSNGPNGTLHVHSSHDHSLDPGVEPPIRNGLGEYITTMHMTNTATDSTYLDGFKIMLYNKQVTVSQLENETFTLQNHIAKIILTPSGRVGIGDTVAGNYKFNVDSPMRVGGVLHVENGISTGGTININSNNINLNANGSASFSNQVTIGNGFFCSADGSLKVKDLKVTLTGWSDFVFDDGYNLRPLGEVERYIEANRHLPDIPSAQEVEENGVDVGEMNKLLLQKVEELTLYIIDLQKQIDELKSDK